jgi:hypothetical protein
MTDTCDTSIYHAARFAATSLLHRLDREAHFRPFFDLSVREGFMRARHASWDCVDMSGRFTDAWILMRQMMDWPVTEEEEGVRRYLLAMQSPDDGLFYDRSVVEPGDSHPHPSPLPAREREVVETADMFCQSRALMGLTSWFLESGESRVQDSIERLAEGLWNIAVKKDDFCYYLGHRYSPSGWTGVSAYTAKDIGPTALPAYGVLQILPLTRYWETTRSPAAERLILGLLSFFVRESGVIREDGSFTGHLHSWGILPSVAGVLRYAMATGRDELIPWCKRVFDFIVSRSSSFGWVPDGIEVDDGIITGETCVITDLIHLGVKLAECGYDECLDYVEVMARNQLLENQIRDTSRFEFESPEVRAMTLGAYDSWVMPNGLTGCSELGLEGCCTASAIQGIYLAWKHAIRYESGTAHVNLMLSRRSEWLDTMNHQPFEGRFSILVRRPAAVMVRMPNWINLREIRIAMDGASVQPAWVSSHLRIEDARPGSRIDIEFPIPERQTEEEIGGRTYRLTWRGITLMRIEPPGEIYPIFQRSLDGMAELNTLPLDDLKSVPSVDW